MNIYLIWQTERTGYDTYDSVVVAAPDADSARQIRPGFGAWYDENCWGDWASTPDNVTAKLIGVAADGIEQGIICASFNAG